MNLDDGTMTSLLVLAYPVPSAHCQLLSPQAIFNPNRRRNISSSKHPSSMKNKCSTWITVQAYKFDNGIFTLPEFVCRIEKGSQNIKFSSVSTHHQNGIAECTIQMVLETTMATSCPSGNHILVGQSFLVFTATLLSCASGVEYVYQSCFTPVSCGVH